MTNFSNITPGGGLTAHELAGGHTLARHVDVTETKLANRLVNQIAIPRSSSFTNREIAEQVIADAIANNQTQITNWLAGNSSRLQIKHTATTAVFRLLNHGRAKHSGSQVNILSNKLSAGMLRPYKNLWFTQHKIAVNLSALL
ncbi:RNase A-like domain-containing protein [Planktothricoides raciborskii]|uniref:RNase A-like domain-containing protein n=1 Tax=Planktothricoides raciborskii GIHE-MW2 TaxID=2792601 RepID=A0AAU8JIG5_9CYAN